MTTRIAFGIALCIAALIGADLFFDWGGTVFAARKGVDLIQVVAFWR